MNSKVKYYLFKTKTLPSEIVIKKSFRKVKNKGLSIIDKISANIFGTEVATAEFLRKAWNSKYKFENLKELQKHFCERKESNFFVDS